MPEPLNLKRLYGSRYRIGMDEAAKGEPGGTVDPWYQVIPCKHGQIYPYSDKLLAIHSKGFAARRKLEALPGLLVHNWSDDGEAIFLFGLDCFEQVAEIVKPRKRKHLSDSHKKALIESNRIHQFKPKSTVLNAEKQPINGRSPEKTGNSTQANF